MEEWQRMLDSVIHSGPSDLKPHDWATLVNLSEDSINFLLRTLSESGSETDPQALLFLSKEHISIIGRLGCEAAQRCQAKEAPLLQIVDGLLRMAECSAALAVDVGPEEDVRQYLLGLTLSSLQAMASLKEETSFHLRLVEADVTTRLRGIMVRATSLSVYAHARARVCVCQMDCYSFSTVAAAVQRQKSDVWRQAEKE